MAARILAYSAVLQVQELGLQSSYTHDLGTHSFIKKMMALPFLPEEEIEPIFQRLQRHSSEPLQQFTEYVNNTWINSTWGPSDWTAFKKSIRTNNDVEGWDNGLNRRASGRGQLPMYLLIKFLHKQATITALQIRLVSERKLGTLRSNDADGNENVKKTIGFMRKTTTLHVHHALL